MDAILSKVFGIPLEIAHFLCLMCLCTFAFCFCLNDDCYTWSADEVFDEIPVRQWSVCSHR